MTTALAEPTRRVRAGWISLLFLANLGLWLAIYAPIQILLPQQAELLDAADKELVFGIVTGAGGLVALIANPVAGLLSDRTTSRFGRRHPWTIGGAVVGAAGLVVLALAGNVAVMVLGWCLVQAGLNAMLATLISAIPDRVPVGQRAQTGGFVGISQMFGTVLGAVLVTSIVTGLVAGYLASAVVLLLGAAAFVLFTPDAVLPKELVPKTRLELWVSPRRHRGFAWMWCCHFVINLGNAFGTFYLLFFLKDVVGRADPEGSLLVLMAGYGLALILGALVAGRLSDASGRRKPYVLVAVAFMAGAALVLVVWPTWVASLIAGPLLGAGFGIYWAVAIALLTQLLPAAADRAKDLGVVNIANALPQVFAPLLASGILAGLGYAGLFGASALATLIAGVFVTRIRTAA
ncbi:MFS transporter [Kibdelosporangium persicum]|uniref:Multidrug resistance protein MdtL n=1 Tax=Kibdelosporangium persicum TaxID=2698649 RepID=A0ABX2EY85_9PSEU|nr:MFS transporter [Kibdelosporangium persicum]NRN64016.1 Multidrug resistance protein MdtL [Kibdelosporangium persicum]